MSEKIERLEYIKINKYSSTPLYEQLYVCVKDAIRKGILKPGEKLPTEDEVSRRFQLSRPVIRQAYLELVNDGMIDRERGRGSFVKQREYKNMSMYSLVNFIEEAHQLNSKPFIKVIGLKLLIDDVEIHNRMQLPLDEPLLKIKRMRYLDAEPASFIENYVSLKRFPDLVNVDFSKESLYNTFIEKYGCKPSKAERKFLAKIVPDDLFVFLGVKQYSACHIIESVVYDQFDHVLEFSREYFAGDTNSFSMTVYSEN